VKTLRLATLAVLAAGCSPASDDENLTDYGRPDVHDGEAVDIGPRPDGISIDSPLPDGYGIEVSEGGDGCGIRNACGGCSNLRASPGQACGGCGGTYACNGPEDVRCVGGCSPVGCADNSREGFRSTTTYTEIAACAGGFGIAGLFDIAVSCDRNAGNTSTNPSGSGCSAEDLCAEGWRLCASPAEVRDRTHAGIPDDWEANAFYAAKVSGPASDEVCGMGTNDFYGLGSTGGGADRGTCAPLTRTSGDQCGDLPSPWDCGESPGIWQYDEATQVTKPGATGGGVLCCLGAGI
jgi:hypothetical protein